MEVEELGSDAVRFILPKKTSIADWIDNDVIKSFLVTKREIEGKDI
jgi:hypothetical protein